MAINKFLGNSIITRLSNLEKIDQKALTKILKTTYHPEIEGTWVDMSGFIAPLYLVK